MFPVETSLDHIVVVAAVLEEGVDFCENALGVKLVKGGEHLRVGTHNYLLNLDDGMYLEVIAINPAAGAIDFPRWFGMDCPEQRKRAAAGPYVATFVARTNDIARAVGQLPELGPARDMRRASLEWQITIPENGGLVDVGTVPTVIQWPDGVHPTQNMPSSGCRLECLEAFHPDPSHLRSTWSRIGLAEHERLLIRPSATPVPYLVARLGTPNGIIELR